MCMCAGEKGQGRDEEGDKEIRRGREREREREGFTHCNLSHALTHVHVIVTSFSEDPLYTQLWFLNPHIYTLVTTWPSIKAFHY